MTIITETAKTVIRAYVTTGEAVKHLNVDYRIDWSNGDITFDSVSYLM